MPLSRAFTRYPRRSTVVATTASRQYRISGLCATESVVLRCGLRTLLGNDEIGSGLELSIPHTLAGNITVAG